MEFTWKMYSFLIVSSRHLCFIISFVFGTRWISIHKKNLREKIFCLLFFVFVVVASRGSPKNTHIIHFLQNLNFFIFPNDFRTLVSHPFDDNKLILMIASALNRFCYFLVYGHKLFTFFFHHTGTFMYICF